MQLGLEKSSGGKKRKEEKAKLGRKRFRSSTDLVIAQPTQCGVLEQMLPSEILHGAEMARP